MSLMFRRSDLYPFFWSCLLYVVGTGLTFAVSLRGEALVNYFGIVLPNFSGGVGGISGRSGLEDVVSSLTLSSVISSISYFLGVVALLVLVLLLVPSARLKLVLRALYGFAFAWGTLVVLLLFLPWYLSLFVAVAVSLWWLFTGIVWLHNLLLVLTVVALGAVFGAMVSPWLVVLVMALIAVYDYLAVRFKLMQWMVRKLGESETLPAFFMPRRLAGWKSRLKGEVVGNLIDGRGGERAAVLGGGDIFFPMMLVSSVIFSAGVSGALLVALFALLGLAAAWAVHLFWAGGKAVAALPPISGFSLVGLLLVRFLWL